MVLTDTDKIIIDKHNVRGQTWVYIPIQFKKEIQICKKLKAPSIWYNDWNRNGKLVAVEFVFENHRKLPKLGRATHIIYT